MNKNLKKMPIDFIARAQKAAIDYFGIRYSSTTVAYATKSVTVFEHGGEIIILPGILHDKIEAPYCVEFDLAYSYGSSYVQSTRIY